MTISEEERQRLLGEKQDVTVTYPRFHRSGVMAALMGMLAGLGMLVLITTTLTAGAVLMNLEFDLLRLDGDVREMSIIGIIVTALVVLISTLVGGFVAGRTARHGGIRTGLGSSLWLVLVLAMFAGWTLLLGALSGTFNGFNLADRLARFDTANLRMGAALTGGGLFVLALIGGLIGGRLGETGEEGAVVNIRDTDSKAHETETESQDQAAPVREPEESPPQPVSSNHQPAGRHSPDE